MRFIILCVCAPHVLLRPICLDTENKGAPPSAVGIGKGKERGQGPRGTPYRWHLAPGCS